mgnify:FL=1
MSINHRGLEVWFEVELQRMGVHYTRPEKIRGSTNTLDFQLLLPAELGGPVCVEVKTWSSERLHDQLRRSGMESSGIVVLIGEPSVRLFANMLHTYYLAWL